MDKLTFNVYKNKFKQQESQPNYTGVYEPKDEMIIEQGVLYDIAVWIDEEKGKCGASISKMSDERAEKHRLKQKEYKENKRQKAKPESKSTDVDLPTKSKLPMLSMKQNEEDDLPF